MLANIPGLPHPGGMALPNPVPIVWRCASHKPSRKRHGPEGVLLRAAYQTTGTPVMKKVMVGVAVALALVTSNAAADGVDRRYPPTIAAPAPYVAPSWTGLYIGAGVGGAAVIHDFSIRDVDLGDNR